MIYLTVAMLWSFFSFLVHWNVFPQHLERLHELLIVFFISIPITYYHFVSVYTDSVDSKRIWTGYAILAVFAVFTLTGRVIQKTKVTADGILIFDLGWALLALAVIAIPFMLLSIWLLVKHYRHSSDYHVRNKTAYLIAGGAVVLSLGLTNLSDRLSQFPIDQFGNMLNALLITFVVLKYQLLDIIVVIRKGLTYSVLTVVITAVYLLLFYFIQSQLGFWPGLGTAAVLALLFAILFQFLRGFTQRWVDRLFYRGTYDYRQTLLTFSQRMRSVLNLSELAEDMLFPIVKALYTKQVVLLLPDTDSGEFAARFIQPVEEEELARAMRIRVDSPIVAWFQLNKGSLDREQIDVLPEFESLWKPERDDIESLELALFCPLRRKDTLVGILALSKKRSETSYSGEDIDLLTTMTNEAAVVIENAMMFDNLREQQSRVEQLLVRTVQAQEEERRRISIELHDGVAQWLVGANYQLQSCQAIMATGNLDEAKDDMGKLETTLDKSLKEIRSVIAGLRPPALEELGLVHALQQAIKEFNSDGIALKFEALGEPIRLSPSAELTIYRVVQESLNNVKKHSEATSATVKLQFTQDKVSIEVNDNGKGFDYFRTIRQATSTGHMGLLGMRERALMMGGKLKIKSKVGDGVRINLTLPINSSTE